jgi:hypothetical protein
VKAALKMLRTIFSRRTKKTKMNPFELQKVKEIQSAEPVTHWAISPLVRWSFRASVSTRSSTARNRLMVILRNNVNIY